MSSRQPIFVNLKFNTMKNTLQMYEHYLYMQYYYSTKCNILIMINYSYIHKTFMKLFFHKNFPFIQYIMPSDFYNRHKYRYAIFSILHPLSIMLMPDSLFPKSIWQYFLLATADKSDELQIPFFPYLIVKTIFHETSKPGPSKIETSF